MDSLKPEDLMEEACEGKPVPLVDLSIIEDLEEDPKDKIEATIRKMMDWTKMTRKGKVG